MVLVLADTHSQGVGTGSEPEKAGPAIPNQIKLNQFSWMKSTTIHAYNTAMISLNAVTFAEFCHMMSIETMEVCTEFKCNLSSCC